MSRSANQTYTRQVRFPRWKKRGCIDMRLPIGMCALLAADGFLSDLATDCSHWTRKRTTNAKICHIRSAKNSESTLVALDGFADCADWIK